MAGTGCKKILLISDSEFSLARHWFYYVSISYTSRGKGTLGKGDGLGGA